MALTDPPHREFHQPHTLLLEEPTVPRQIDFLIPEKRSIKLGVLYMRAATAYVQETASPGRHLGITDHCGVNPCCEALDVAVENDRVAH
jgi:hypothetical protein